MMGRTVFWVYRAVMMLLVPVILIRYLLKAGTQPTYRERLLERFGILPDQLPTGMLWVHAVSVGEVNAATPLVKNLLSKTDHSILMTCVTPTGSAQIRQTFADQVAHVYAPVDAAVVVNRFLRRLRPAAIVIMETEIWPSLIVCGHSKGIPVMFANMRLSDRTFRRASGMTRFSRFVLGGADSFCVQTEEDQTRIRQLGASPAKITITGNMKFDLEAPAAVLDKGQAIRERLGGHNAQIIILGSSHEGEEALFLAVFEKLKVEFQNLLCIVVPRHPERFDRVFESMSGSGISAVRSSQWDGSNLQSIDVVLVDRMGELMQYYAASDIAVVGGSFVPVGGHNILEPLMVGTPPVFGPEMSNFRQISQLVLSAEAGIQVLDADGLGPQMAQLLRCPELRETLGGNGKRLLAGNQGATQTTSEKLLSLI